ncbi:MAG: aryl-sulfate sulfotransferase [Acidobacteriia bacterium]|nr:aryl-sulfate sulfotransferase [Terriglobia bacterium]
MASLGLQFLRVGIAGFALTAISSAQMSVTLTPSLPSPAPVATMITWNASVPDSPAGTIWYRFRVREGGGDYTVIRDYGPLASLDWTAADHEGLYEVEVSAKNRQTGELAATSSVYQMLSRVGSAGPVISPTSHPLVFLYSALCPGGSRMKVQFQAWEGAIQETPFKECQAGRSINFYLAGLRSNTAYTARHIIDARGQLTTGPDILFGMGQQATGLFTETVLQPPATQISSPILLGSSLNGSVAHDLEGNVVWYTNNGIYTVTRAEDGGYFWGVIESQQLDVSQQVIRKFDLVGMTVLETNAARVNEQLAAMGRRPITGFHHEARTLPDGRIAALAGVEQILTDVQGPGPVDVLGDMIVVLDSNLNVVWTWDAFDHLDVTRTAVLGETCGPVSACAPFYLAKAANDWTHGNALQQTPDGELLYSSRHQDWLIKVSYRNGTGDGHVIWRLGKDGDFQINSTDPWPWFSHQHDGNFELSDPSALLVFDDGNTRVASIGGHSRGQVFKLDEQNRIASFILNADLGVFSLAVGSAQLLPDHNYHFDAGFVPEGKGVAYSIEVDGAGHIVYEAKANAILYRTFRMTNLYTPN